MPDYIVVTPLNDLVPGSAIRLAFAKGSIAVFTIGDQRFAVDDRCVRCGQSLATGEIFGTTVRCAGCSWRYELATGNVVGIPGLRIETFETRVEKSQLFIKAPKALTRHHPP